MKRIVATCGPESRAEASLAEKAMKPKNVADAVISSRARVVGVVFIKLPDDNMHEITYRDAHRSDREVIVEFQLAMARETEDLELDHDVCAKGVDAVFAEPKHGQYFVPKQQAKSSLHC